jgi:hypothetical protein
VEAGESFEAQKVVRAFEQDHKGHPVGSTDLDEVESYTNVSETYIARMESEVQEDVGETESVAEPAPEEDQIEVEAEPAGDAEEGEEAGDESSKTRRICPNCGSHDINEVIDKTKIISYIPKPMYAKKLVCRRCSTEFG